MADKTVRYTPEFRRQMVAQRTVLAILLRCRSPPEPDPEFHLLPSRFSPAGSRQWCLDANPLTPSPHRKRHGARQNRRGHESALPAARSHTAAKHQLLDPACQISRACVGGARAPRGSSE